ncbi:MAG TPA: Maf family protein [Planctomycetota bacterium]
MACHPELKGMRLVLASVSPQRHRILKDAGYSFEVADPGEVENAIASAPTPEALAIAKARAKAMGVAAALTGPVPAVVIGCDTVVALGEEVIGKPLDRTDAACILTRLSGRRQRVISGLCLWPVASATAPGSEPAGQPYLSAITTWVTMRPMSAAEIEAYVASGEADGKAGAYAIQETGDKFVESLEGSLLNVVGFPLEEFQQRLPECIRKWGFE